MAKIPKQSRFFAGNISDTILFQIVDWLCGEKQRRFSFGKLSTCSTQAKGQGVGIGGQQSDQGEKEILGVEEQGMI